VRQLDRVLKTKQRDILVVKAHADGAKRLFVALEAYSHDEEIAASCVISVDLETLVVELLVEMDGSSVDYLHQGGWHGLLQRDQVIELGANPPITKVQLGEGGRLAVIARAGDTTLVGGTKRVGNYATDGFVARVGKGKLGMIFETSKQKQLHQGYVNAVAVGPKGMLHAAGGAMGEDRLFRLFSGKATLEGVPLFGEEVYALHELKDGTVMVGCRHAAAVVKNGKAQALTGVSGQVHGVTTFRGTEYWMSHDGMDHITLFKRTGTKLAKKYRTKYHYIGYRNLHGAPEARMTATDDLLVVTNKDRIHLYDGKKWSQLGITADVKKLVKRLPTAMKS